MAEVYKAACIAFGQPVQSFDFAYRDKDNNYHEERDLTPQAFYQKYVGLSLRDYVAVINKQLKHGQAIWFACDAGAFGARKEGIWDPASVQYEALLGGFSTAMPKGKRLEYNSSSATHAMLLTGVHFDKDGQPDRWKIENSWGKDVGDQGYFVCSSRHFSPEQLALLEKEPVVINAWDEDY